MIQFIKSADRHYGELEATARQGETYKLMYVQKVFSNTEIIMHRTFWVGVYPGMNEGMIDFMIDKIREFVKDKEKKEG